ncbi:MAG TPA: Gfo/Idh/MocA family oxidoreductase [Candidatus Sulfopaludibacter sp.]|jgi:predicted dehydrogenase|nr:Gfo/Idh/MocA family oxidoreductase [Candidatus Sulfopaludibacter sp.]
MADSYDRRDFLKTVGATGLTLEAAKSALAAKSTSKAATGRVIGANDRINIGVIGCGGRGMDVARTFTEVGNADNSCQIVAVCDVYEKRKRLASERFKAKGYTDYRELLQQSDLDAIYIATPDHWHCKNAIDAMDHGKDVYLEKPMVHTNEEARQLVATVKETKRVLQVGSQTTSADIWAKAKKAIADGAIGQMLMSQGSYHRNSIEGEWNWPIDANAGPDGKGDNHIDWDLWLGSQYKLSPKRAYDADRFFRFRKYWDYSLGIASDLFYHVIAPLNICWDEPQFPVKVMATGGIYVFKEKREVPDTFHLMAEYAKGHSLVLSSSMANDTHIPGLIRGHEGSIIMVEHGQFERNVPYITVKPQVKGGKAIGGEKYSEKFGVKDYQIQVDQTNMQTAHVKNFLHCVRTREKPRLDVETGAKAVVVINLAAQSYREGKVMYWDEKHWKATDKPVKA